MTTTQVVDVYNHTPMDAPHDNDPVTFGVILKYLGMLFAGIFSFIAIWVAKKIFGWITKQFEDRVKRIEDAVSKVEAFSDQFKTLEKNDAKIFEQLKDIDNRVKHIEKKLNDK